MTNKTIAEIKEEMQDLELSLKIKIEEFARANPELDLNIEIHKDEMFVLSESVPAYRYIPKIEVILK